MVRYGYICLDAAASCNHISYIWLVIHWLHVATHGYTANIIVAAAVVAAVVVAAAVAFVVAAVAAAVAVVVWLHMVTYGCVVLHMGVPFRATGGSHRVTFVYVRLQLVILGYVWLRMDTYGCIWLHSCFFSTIPVHMAANGHIWLHMVT